MKNHQLLLKLVLLFIVISCNPDSENFSKTELFLLDGVWKLESSEKKTYFDDELVDSRLIISESEVYNLTFSKDYTVSFEADFYKHKIIGNWKLIDNDKFLTTDLSIDPGGSSGYGTIYFFPKNEIIEIDKNKMLLESLSDKLVNYNGEKIQVKNVSRSLFLKVK